VKSPAPLTRSAATGIAALAVAATTATSAAACPPAHKPPAAAVRHVFVINLENKGYATTFGAGSPAPYLATTLRRQGVLLDRYHGTAHNSLPNYLAQISGQGPNPQQQADCQSYSPFLGTGTTVAPQQAVGDGCARPRPAHTRLSTAWTQPSKRPPRTSTPHGTTRSSTSPPSRAHRRVPRTTSTSRS